MTDSLPNLRYERKLLASNCPLDEVVALVRRHPSLFREVYPPRAVNNIYLDSPGLRDYFDHLNGAADRTKTRVRWYGPWVEQVEKPVLERKIKRGLVSGKISHPLPPLSLKDAVRSEAVGAVIERADMPEILRSGLRFLRPAIINRYQRRYFLSVDGHYRLTVDWGLEFYGIAEAAGRTGCLRPRNPVIVVELKYHPCYAESLDHVTNGFPFRLSRCSKYVLGVDIVAAS